MNLIESFARALPPRDQVETRNATRLTRLSWGESAYLHTIIKPVEFSIVTEVAQELDFPPSLVVHFRRCNGAQLFVASVTCRGMSLFGCRERDKPFDRSSSEPSAIDIRQKKGVVSGCVVFGSYGYDGSMLMLDRQDETVRCSYGRDAARTRRQWPSLDEFLESEVQRMSQLFAPDGTCLVPCAELVPPSESALGQEDVRPRP